MDAKQLEDTLRSSNFIYEQAWKAGHHAGYIEGYRTAMADAKRTVGEVFGDAEKNLALLNKQAG